MIENRLDKNRLDTFVARYGHNTKLSEEVIIIVFFLLWHNDSGVTIYCSHSNNTTYTKLKRLFWRRYWQMSQGIIVRRNIESQTENIFSLVHYCKQQLFSLTKHVVVWKILILQQCTKLKIVYPKLKSSPILP